MCYKTLNYPLFYGEKRPFLLTKSTETNVIGLFAMAKMNLNIIYIIGWRS